MRPGAVLAARRGAAGRSAALAGRFRRRQAVRAAVAEHGLTVAGLACFTLAAAMVAVPLGLAVAGDACFVLELRVGE